MKKARDKYYNKRGKKKLLSIIEIIWKLQEKIRKISIETWKKNKERENIKNRYRFMLEDQKEKLTKYQRNFYAVIVNKKELHASKNILF